MLKRGIYKISWVIQVIFAKFLGGVVYLHNFRGKSPVKELLGHKELKMTLRYSHLAPAHKKNAVQVMSQILGKKSTIQKLYNFGS